MAFNVKGLLSGIAGLPNAIGQGLLGPMPVNSQLGLDPNSLSQARQQALTDMAMGLMAGDRRNPGATLMGATQNARQGFQGRIFDMLKEQEYLRMQAQREDIKAKAEAARAADPRLANLTDEQVLSTQAARVDPNLEQRQTEFGYQQEKDAKSFAADEKRWGADYSLRLKQFGLSQMNSDREYGIGVARLAMDQERLNAEMAKRNLPNVDEVEVRKRRESAFAGASMVSLLQQLKADVAQNGTETIGPGAGRQGALYGSILSEFKQAKQMGTLDKGLLDLFDKMLKDPTTFLNAGGAVTGAIPAQLDTLIKQTSDTYKSDYDYLSQYGLNGGLPEIKPPPSGASGGWSIRKK